MKSSIRPPLLPTTSANGSSTTTPTTFNTTPAPVRFSPPGERRKRCKTLKRKFLPNGGSTNDSITDEDSIYLTNSTTSRNKFTLNKQTSKPDDGTDLEEEEVETHALVVDSSGPYES